MTKTVVTEEKPNSVPHGVLLMSWREVVRVALIGAVVGLATYALTVVLDKYIITGLACGAEPSGALNCDSKEYVASAAAMLLVAIGALFALVQSRVYRPLLVLILAAAGLWNVTLLALNTSWFASIFAMALIFAIGYAAFAWLVQIRNFFLATALGIVVVVLMRLIISA